MFFTLSLTFKFFVVRVHRFLTSSACRSASELLDELLLLEDEELLLDEAPGDLYHSHSKLGYCTVDVVVAVFRQLFLTTDVAPGTAVPIEGVLLLLLKGFLVSIVLSFYSPQYNKSSISFFDCFKESVESFLPLNTKPSSPHVATSYNSSGDI